MKFKKIFSLAAATMVAANVVAASASADWNTNIDGLAEGINIGTGNYMITLFCNDELSDDIPLMDRGIDLSKLGYVSFTFQVNEEDREFFNGSFGGGVGASIHTTNILSEPKEPKAPKEEKYEGKPEEYAAAVEKYEKKLERYPAQVAAYEAYVASDPISKTKPGGGETTLWGYYNWDCAYQYWGVLDPNAPDPDSYDIDGNFMEGMPEYINYIDLNQTAFLETLGDYTYRIKTPIANPVAEGDCTVDEITDVRVYLQCWSASAFVATVTRTVIYDLDGKAMMAFDKQGNVVDVTADDDKEPVVPTAPAEGEEPSTDSESESTPADSTPADSSTTNDSTPASTPASSTATSASDDGGFPVGAIVGIAAGVVVVIVVVIVVVAKKKKG